MMSTRAVRRCHVKVTSRGVRLLALLVLLGALPAEPSEAAALAVGPGDQEVVAATGADIMKSTEGGRTWRALLRPGP